MNNFLQSPAYHHQSYTATTPSISNNNWHFDSGAFMICTPDVGDIINPVPLSNPLSIGSANGAILLATHVGTSFFYNLPIYLVPSAAVKLVSIGVLTEFGFHLHTNKDKSLSIFNSINRTICTCPLQPNKVWFFPNHLMRPTVTLPTSDFSGNKNLSPAVSTPPLVGLPLQLPINPIHFTKEMISRATQARQMHEFLCHPHDSALKSILNQGLMARYSHLTPADVDLMAEFFGSCLSCRIGKARYHDLHSQSTSSPSTKIGQRIFFDLQLLTTTSRGGNTQAIIFIDDFSRFLTVLGAKTKNHSDVLDCLRQLISLYNSEGYPVLSFCSDSEAICQSLTIPLGLLQASISFSTPDAHCHKVERAIQQIDQKVVATLAAMPYVLPPHLILYAKRFCADAINLTPQSTLSASTVPYVLFYKRKPTLNSDPSKSFTPFGATCLVKYTDGQRSTIATNSSLNFNNVDKAGIAINLGISPNHPGDNIFFQPSNNTILFRDSFDMVSTIPDNCPVQPVIQQTYITTSTQIFKCAESCWRCARQ